MDVYHTPSGGKSSPPSTAAEERPTRQPGERASAQGHPRRVPLSLATVDIHPSPSALSLSTLAQSASPHPPRSFVPLWSPDSPLHINSRSCHRLPEQPLPSPFLSLSPPVAVCDSDSASFFLHSVTKTCARPRLAPHATIFCICDSTQAPSYGRLMFQGALFPPIGSSHSDSSAPSDITASALPEATRHR